MSKIDFKVLMFGARRTGKTSILASMLTSFQEVTSGTNITFSPKTNKTLKKLQEKREELEHVFNCKTPNDFWEIDPNPTSEIAAYSFNMNHQGSSNEYTVTFIDIPGEALNDVDRIEEAKEWLSKCDVVIIAIDTPHMVEENGKFNEAFNKTFTLYNLFVGCDEFYKSCKLILFVPLKCEKYYHEKRMDEVKWAIRHYYNNIIAHMKNPKINSNITMAITPILTMGDVVFSHFGKNNRGLTETIAMGGEKFRPKHVYYKLRNGQAKFSPKYCDQPLVYTLSFISKIIK